MKKRFISILFALLLTVLSFTQVACNAQNPQPSPTPSITPSAQPGISSIYSVENASKILTLGQESLSRKMGMTLSGRIENTFTAEKSLYFYDLSLNFAHNTARFVLKTETDELFTAYGNNNGFFVQEGTQIRPIEDILSEYELEALSLLLQPLSGGDFSGILSLWDDHFGEDVFGKTENDGFSLSAKNDSSQKINSYLTQFRPLFALAGKEWVNIFFPDLIEGEADEWFAAKKTWLMDSTLQTLLAPVSQNPTYLQIASHLTLELFHLSYVDFLSEYGDKTLSDVLSVLLKDVEGVPPAFTVPSVLKLSLNTLLQNLWDNPVQQTLEETLAAISPELSPLVDRWLHKTAFTFVGLAAQIHCHADGTPDYGLLSVGIAGVHTESGNASTNFRNTILLSLHVDYQTPEIILPDIDLSPSTQPSVAPSV